MDDLVAYYDTGIEGERLSTGAGPLELLRTQEIVGRFVAPGSSVADIGGATGIYSDWLAKLGCRVELIDPVASHVDAAHARAGEPPRFGVRLGDARQLPFADEEHDAVLLLGPLYHLSERADRDAALREAARVCRRGGAVVAAAISRAAPLLHTTFLGTIADDRVFANARDEYANGRRVAPERRRGPFPDGYFHSPREFAEELAAAGLEVLDVYGVEGTGWMLPDLDERLRDAASRARLLEVLRLVERDPNVLGASPHLLAVATRPLSR